MALLQRIKIWYYEFLLGKNLQKFTHVTTAGTLRRYFSTLFNRKKSKEAEEMWNKLKDTPPEYDPFSDPSLAINYEYYMSLPTTDGKLKYLHSIVRRRNKAYRTPKIHKYTKR